MPNPQKNTVYLDFKKKVANGKNPFELIFEAIAKVSSNEIKKK